MKKTNKIIVALCIMLTILAISVVSFGTAIDPSELTGTAPTEVTEIKDLGNRIIGIVQTVGVVIAVVILLILGIKYMMGSAEEKADYKKSMIPYIVGAILIFAASAIVGVVYDIANSLNTQK